MFGTGFTSLKQKTRQFLLPCTRAVAGLSHDQTSSRTSRSTHFINEHRHQRISFVRCRDGNGDGTATVASSLLSVMARRHVGKVTRKKEPRIAFGVWFGVSFVSLREAPRCASVAATGCSSVARAPLLVRVVGHLGVAHVELLAEQIEHVSVLLRGGQYKETSSVKD